MPMPRIDTYWRNRVRELAEQNPRVSSRKITAQLEGEAKALKREDWPSEKSVRNIIAEHRDAPEQERRLYRLVYWPESFTGNPDLPWESAREVLVAMSYIEKYQPGGVGGRPTIRMAKWYWRLYLVDPNGGISGRVHLARMLAAYEAGDRSGTDATWRSVERQLVSPDSDEGVIARTSDVEYRGVSR